MAAARRIRSNRVKELREAQKLTQEELAVLMEVHFTTIARHEAGNRTISDEMAKRYAAVFKCQTHEVFVKLDAALISEERDDDA